MSIAECARLQRTKEEVLFRDLWEESRKERLPERDRISLLKKGLAIWVCSAYAKKRGAARTLGPLSKDEFRLCELLYEHIGTAVREEWSIQRLISTLCVVAISEDGVQL